jgi:hypothetical protein
LLSICISSIIRWWKIARYLISSFLEVRKIETLIIFYFPHERMLTFISMWQCIAGCALFDNDSRRCIMLDWGNILLDCRHYRKLVPWRRAYYSLTKLPSLKSICQVSNTCLCYSSSRQHFGYWGCWPPKEKRWERLSSK